MTATIFEAKTQLSELLKRAQAGERVIITSGREKTPVAELKALPPKRKERLGFLKGIMEPISDEALFAPLPEEWTGIVDSPNDPVNWTEERIARINNEADAKWEAELAAQKRRANP